MKAAGSELVFTLPEGVEFRQPLAGPVARMCACIMDLLLSLGIGAALGRLLTGLVFIHYDLAMALYTLVTFLVFFGYNIVFEMLWRGQTPGKRVCRLRVIDAAGLELRPSQVIMRNILRLVDLLPGFYLLGGLVSFLNPQRRRLGDLAANTLVVRLPKPFTPDLDQLQAGRHNSLLDLPHLAARYRQYLGPTEAAWLLQAVLRRESLEPTARVALFSEAAAKLKALVIYPDEIRERLTDEQYVRNVVDILYRRSQGAAKGAEAPSIAVETPPPLQIQ